MELYTHTRPANFTDSVLWNGKVVPLLRNTIKGAVWMQGEVSIPVLDLYEAYLTCLCVGTNAVCMGPSLHFAGQENA